MASQDGLDRLFFELASESRLGILQELLTERLRMQELARKLNMTDTETCRQLQRLSEARLIQKQPDAKYKLTAYAKLVLDTSSPLGFIYRFREYFLEHDVSCLPYEFVNRLGELSAAELSGEVMSTLNRARKMVYEAEEYLWVIAEQVDSSHAQITNEKVSEGLRLKFIMPKDFNQTVKVSPEMLLCPHCRKQMIEDESKLRGRVCGFCERKQLERICLSLLINEKESCVLLRRVNGEMDYVGFFGTDEKFRKWTRDLFMHYWERAEQWYPGIQIK